MGSSSPNIVGVKIKTYVKPPPRSRNAHLIAATPKELVDGHLCPRWPSLKATDVVNRPSGQEANRQSCHENQIVSTPWGEMDHQPYLRGFPGGGPVQNN